MIAAIYARKSTDQAGGVSEPMLGPASAVRG